MAGRVVPPERNAAMVNLLVLLRFESDDATGLPEAAIEAYATRVRENGGRIVEREYDQMLLYLTDMRWGLHSLRDLLAEARRDRFEVRAAIVQAVLARAAPGQPQSGFTARTLDTLLRLAGQVGRQQVGVTPKMLSLIELAAPEFAGRFDALEIPVTALPGESRPQPVRVMAG